MKSILTPATLASAYTLLRCTAPFEKWELPPADQIVFKVVGNTFHFGKCWTRWNNRQFKDTRHFEIEVSEATVHTLERLLRCMAHEMIHVREGVNAQCGTEKLRMAKHGKMFYRLEGQICRAHRWDAPLL